MSFEKQRNVLHNFYYKDEEEENEGEGENFNVEDSDYDETGNSHSSGDEFEKMKSPVYSETESDEEKEVIVREDIKHTKTETLDKPKKEMEVEDVASKQKRLDAKREKKKKLWDEYMNEQQKQQQQQKSSLESSAVGVANSNGTTVGDEQTKPKSVNNNNNMNTPSGDDQNNEHNNSQNNLPNVNEEIKIEEVKSSEDEQSSTSNLEADVENRDDLKTTISPNIPIGDKNNVDHTIEADRDNHDETPQLRDRSAYFSGDVSVMQRKKRIAEQYVEKTQRTRSVDPNKDVKYQGLMDMKDLKFNNLEFNDLKFPSLSPEKKNGMFSSSIYALLSFCM